MTINIFEAAAKGNLEAIQSFVEKGVNIKQRDQNGWTPLHHASANGHLDAIKVILEIAGKTKNGAQIDAIEKEDYTALHLAAKGGHLEIVELLIEEGAEIYAKDRTGYTALHHASEQNHPKVVEFLINAGTNPDTKGLISYFGTTPLECAIYRDCIEAVGILLSKGANLETEFGTSITKAIRHLRSEDKIEGKELKMKVIELLVKAGADLHKKDPETRESAMEYAAKHPPCKEFFKKLCEWGIEIPSNIQNKLDSHEDSTSLAQDDSVSLLGGAEV